MLSLPKTTDAGIEDAIQNACADVRFYTKRGMELCDALQLVKSSSCLGPKSWDRVRMLSISADCAMHRDPTDGD